MSQHLLINLDLWRSEGVVSTDTGELVKLTHSDKFLYTWFLNRYKWWSSQNKVFYDNIVDICEATGYGDRAVRLFIDKAVKAGFVVRTKKWKSNSYRVEDIFSSPSWKVVMPNGQTLSAAHPKKTTTPAPEEDECPF